MDSSSIFYESSSYADSDSTLISSDSKFDVAEENFSRQLNSEKVMPNLLSSPFHPKIEPKECGKLHEKARADIQIYKSVTKYNDKMDLCKTPAFTGISDKTRITIPIHESSNDRLSDQIRITKSNVRNTAVLF